MSSSAKKREGGAAAGRPSKRAKAVADSWHWSNTHGGTVLVGVSPGAGAGAAVDAKGKERTPTWSEHAAIFDLDNTLVEPKSGKVFPKDAQDWRFLPGARERLRDLATQGWDIVVISNQMGIAKGKQTAADWAGKLEAIFTEAAVPATVFASIADNKFDRARKPMPGMLRCFEELRRGNGSSTGASAGEPGGGKLPGPALNMATCFYVGDAAGRPKDWAPKRKKDHGCGDREFALNAGLRFFTPEEWLDRPRVAWEPARELAEAAANGGKCQSGASGVPFTLFDPRSEVATAFPAACMDLINACSSSSSSSSGSGGSGSSGSPTVIVNVGYPASGKSSFYRRYLAPAGYVHVNMDTLKTRAKCEKVMKQALGEGRSVCVDNLNRDRATRKPWLDMAHAHKARTLCLHFDASLELATHNNMFRVMRKGDTKLAVPGVARMIYRKNFEEPTVKEGFAEVIRVPFVPTFESEADEELFFMYYCD